jgi:hypothetical protein
MEVIAVDAGSDKAREATLTVGQLISYLQQYDTSLPVVPFYSEGEGNFSIIELQDCNGPEVTMFIEPHVFSNPEQMALMTVREKDNIPPHTIPRFDALWKIFSNSEEHAKGIRETAQGMGIEVPITFYEGKANECKRGIDILNRYLTDTLMVPPTEIRGWLAKWGENK